MFPMFQEALEHQRLRTTNRQEPVDPSRAVTWIVHRVLQKQVTMQRTTCVRERGREREREKEQGMSSWCEHIPGYTSLSIANEMVLLFALVSALLTFNTICSDGCNESIWLWTTATMVSGKHSAALQTNDTRKHTHMHTRKSVRVNHYQPTKQLSACCIKIPFSGFESDGLVFDFNGIGFNQCCTHFDTE
jgi:hypothetical protein